MFNVEYVKYGGKFLEWDMWLNIVVGSVWGLSYLYYDCIFYIIYRDIKISNILFDEDMEVCVLDFGFVKLISLY